MNIDRLRKITSHWLMERRLLDAEDEREDGLHPEQARQHDIIGDTVEAMKHYVAIMEAAGDEDPVKLIQAAKNLPLDGSSRRVAPGTMLHGYFTEHRTGKRSFGISWADICETDELVVPGDTEYGSADFSQFYATTEEAEAAEAAREEGGAS